MDTESTAADGRGQFPNTHWSVVLAAGRPEGERAEEALSTLCHAYWFPLYAFARRRGLGPEDARDITQGFFAHLIASRLCARAEQDKGRFRSFLLRAFDHFRVSVYRRESAEKRGGGRPLISLDAGDAESRYGAELSVEQTPEALYDRLWGLAVLDQAFRLLEAEQRRLSRGPIFDRLHPFLQGGREGDSYNRIAGELGTTESTIRVTVLRLRRRYRELVRAVILETVAHPSEADAEMRDLIAILRAGQVGRI